MIDTTPVLDSFQAKKAGRNVEGAAKDLSRDARHDSGRLGDKAEDAAGDLKRDAKGAARDTQVRRLLYILEFPSCSVCNVICSNIFKVTVCECVSKILL